MMADKMQQNSALFLDRTDGKLRQTAAFTPAIRLIWATGSRYRVLFATYRWPSGNANHRRSGKKSMEGCLGN
jgi:hypothetical protein